MTFIYQNLVHCQQEFIYCLFSIIENKQISAYLQNLSKASMLLGDLDFYIYCDVSKGCRGCYELDPGLDLSSPMRKNWEYFLGLL